MYFPLGLLNGQRIDKTITSKEPSVFFCKFVVGNNFEEIRAWTTIPCLASPHTRVAARKKLRSSLPFSRRQEYDDPTLIYRTVLTVRLTARKAATGRADTTRPG